MESGSDGGDMEGLPRNGASKEVHGSRALWRAVVR
jgi:hypothetical protein